MNEWMKEGTEKIQTNKEINKLINKDMYKQNECMNEWMNGTAGLAYSWTHITVPLSHPQVCSLKLHNGTVWSLQLSLHT